MATGRDEEDLEVAEVLVLFERYEEALVANDVATMDAMFWDDPRVVCFGIADMQVGHEAVVAWRASAAPVSRQRRITSHHVLHLAPGAVTVDVTFADDQPTLGRQSQTWVRRPEGWRIVRAHVSRVPR